MSPFSVARHILPRTAVLLVASASACSSSSGANGTLSDGGASNSGYDAGLGNDASRPLGNDDASSPLDGATVGTPGSDANGVSDVSVGASDAPTSRADAADALAATPDGSVAASAWPDATNRPSVTGSTLTWTGPVGGGPSTGNDVQQMQALTPSGPVTTTMDGQVIENLDITGNASVPSITIANNNVTVRKCRITAGTWVVVAVSSTSGVVIEDSLIDGTGGDGYEGISHPPSGGPMQGVTIRRNNLRGVENAVTDGLANGLIIDNWFNGYYGPDADFVELYDATSNLVIRHNTFDGAVNLGKSGGGSGFLNSGVNLTNIYGTLDGVSVDNNRFVNMPNWGICDDSSQGPSTITWSVTNNGFYNIGTGAMRGNPSKEVISPNTGNFTMENPDDTTGAPINGTGVL